MIWAEGVFDFRERIVRSFIRVFRCRKRARENEVEEFDRERVV